MFNYDDIISQALTDFQSNVRQTLPWWKKLFGIKPQIGIDAKTLSDMIFSFDRHFCIEYQSAQKTFTIEANNTVYVYNVDSFDSKLQCMTYAICDAYLKRHEDYSTYSFG